MTGKRFAATVLLACAAVMAAQPAISEPMSAQQRRSFVTAWKGSCIQVVRDMKNVQRSKSRVSRWCQCVAERYADGFTSADFINFAMGNAREQRQVERRLKPKMDAALNRCEWEMLR